VNFGYRIFAVEDDSVVRLSQKSFNEFYFRENASLLQYAGRMIVIVITIYELKNRKPKRVIRIDTQRVKVNSDGSIDKEHLTEGLILAVNRIFVGYEPRPATVRNSNVVDGKARFDERRWKLARPSPKRSATKRVMKQLFQCLDTSAKIDMECCSIHHEGGYGLDTGRLRFFQTRFVVAEMDDLNIVFHRVKCMGDVLFGGNAYRAASVIENGFGFHNCSPRFVRCHMAHVHSRNNARLRIEGTSRCLGNLLV